MQKSDDLKGMMQKSNDLKGCDEKQGGGGGDLKDCDAKKVMIWKAMMQKSDDLKGCDAKRLLDTIAIQSQRSHKQACTLTVQNGVTESEYTHSSRLTKVWACLHTHGQVRCRFLKTSGAQLEIFR